MATAVTEHKRHHKKENFLRQFRDEQSKEIKQLTATQFMEIWSHYDIDGIERVSMNFFVRILLGNGYIEGHELDDLLRELASSVNLSDASPEVN
jgi:prophage maintenance system killer protein